MISMVIEGEHKGRPVTINMKGVAYIDGKHRNKVMLTPENVRSFDVIEVDGKKSFASSVVRGAVGGALLGGVGALAGINSAKNVNNAKIKIVFKDGKASLLHVEKHIYDAIVNKCFNLEPEISTDTDTHEQKKTMLERSEEKYQKASEKRQEADIKLEQAKEKTAKQIKDAKETWKDPKKRWLIIGIVIAIIILACIGNLISSDSDENANETTVSAASINILDVNFENINL